MSEEKSYDKLVEENNELKEHNELRYERIVELTKEVDYLQSKIDDVARVWSELTKENKELKNTIKNISIISNNQRSTLAKSLWDSCEKNENLEKENKELRNDD